MFHKSLSRKFNGVCYTSIQFHACFMFMNMKALFSGIFHCWVNYFQASIYFNAFHYFTAFTAKNTCSKPTIETLDKGVKYVHVNTEENKVTSRASFWCLYC